MDPLSITASAITTAGLVLKSVETIQKVFQTSSEIQSLNNEISDFRIILSDAEYVLLRNSQRSGQEHQNVDGLATFIKAAKIKLERLNALVQSATETSTGHCKSGISKLGWLRKGSQARALQEEVRLIKSNIAATLQTLSSSISTKLETDVREVFLINKESSEFQNRFRDESRSLALLHGQSVSQVSNQISKLEGIANQIKSHLNIGVDQVESRSNMSNSTCDSQVETEIQTQSQEALIRAFHNEKVLFESSQMTTVSAVGIRTAHFNKPPCTTYCSCDCHFKGKVKTPESLNKILGSLFINYYGSPINRRPCNERSCHRPVVSLKTSRTVPGTSKIFKYAISGNVAGVKMLIESGLASPHDVSFSSGITPLHLAIGHEQIEMCRFLLQANADPFLEDFRQWTAADNAWSRILSKNLNPTTDTAFRLLFSQTECLERRDFTVLHKIVLGLVSKPLEPELQASTATIDTTDANGRTPLSLTAGLGDANYMKLLLKYGADPNITAEGNFHAPLHFAARAGSWACVKELTDHGAHVDAATHWEQTPLHYCAAYQDSLLCTRCFLEAGADIEARDRDGITPLGWAAISGRQRIARLLLDEGANLESRNISGHTALAQGIINNRHSIVELLLVRGASLTSAFEAGEATILHLVADSADCRTMEILALEQPVSINTMAVDADGLLAKEVLEKREDITETLRGSFESLITGLEYEKDSEGDSEIFIDAVEHHTY